MAKNLFISQFRWFSALPLILLTLALFVLSVLVLTHAQGRQGGAREQLFDFYQRLAPAPGDSLDQFHIVSIDAESTDRIGSWPWPRSILADVVDNAVAAGAKGVVLIEPIDAPDPLSPETIGDFWLSGARDEALAEQLALLPSTDALLAEAMGKAPSLVSIDPGPAARTSTSLRLGETESDDGETVSIALGESNRFAAPSARPRYFVKPELERSSMLSVAALPLDDDGVLRATPALWSAQGRPALTSGVGAARLAINPDDPLILMPNVSAVTEFGQTLDAVRLGEADIKTDDRGSFRLYFPKSTSVPSTSAWRLLDGQASNSQLSGKVILIGRDSATGGAVKTARGDLAPVTVHALIAQQLTEGATSVRPAWAGYVEALAVLLLGALAIMWSQRLDFWKAVGAAAIASALVFALSASAFSFTRLLLDPLPASLALFLGAFSVAGGRSLGAVLTDDNVRGNFQGALPEATMQKLRDEGATEILEGFHREITVLACELRLVADDLQKLEDKPGEVTRLIAAASATLRKTITDIGGAVDQADGGKIYAYFNAPLEMADHVRAGASGALRLVESMDKINSELDAAHNVQIHLAIGMAIGECYIGPMGHGRSNRYSAIGPAVELAGFLRAQAETYGPAIICDDAVYRQTHHHFAFLELDRLKARSSNYQAGRAFSVHALVGNPFIKSSKGYRTLEEAHRQLLSSYRSGDFAAARNHLETARQSPGAKIALFDLYEERIAKMAGKEAPQDWDGSVPVSL